MQLIIVWKLNWFEVLTSAVIGLKANCVLYVHEQSSSLKLRVHQLFTVLKFNIINIKCFQMNARWENVLHAQACSTNMIVMDAGLASAQVLYIHIHVCQYETKINEYLWFKYAQFRCWTFYEPNLVRWINYMKSSLSELFKEGYLNLERPLWCSSCLAQLGISALERLWFRCWTFHVLHQ